MENEKLNEEKINPNELFNDNEKQSNEDKINPEDIIFDDDTDEMPQPDTFDYDKVNKPQVVLKLTPLFKYALHSCIEKLPYNMDALTNPEGNKIKVSDLVKFIDDNFNNMITIENMNLIISFIASAPKYAVHDLMELVEKSQQDLWTLYRADQLQQQSQPAPQNDSSQQ